MKKYEIDATKVNPVDKINEDICNILASVERMEGESYKERV